MFSGEKPEVSHLRLFACLVYVHVLRKKRSKLDPSNKKGIFVGYNESSKTYRVYNPSFTQIKTSRDVIFDEDTTFSRSRPNRANEVHDEEPEAPRATGTDAGEHDPEDHDMIEPKRLEDPPKEVSHKRRSAWARELIQDAKK